ncbi:MAG: hypothetical protein AAF602_11815, partial [Myxococcota bacterium]
MIRYSHTQIGWLTSGLLGLFTLAMIGLALNLGGLLWVAVAILGLAMGTFSTLTVRIDPTHLTVRFGPGPLRRRIALDRIAAFGTVVNSPLWGWGIRLVPGGWMWNVSGLQAVELRFHDGAVFRVGTDEPDALCRALTEAIPDASDLAAAKAELPPARSMWAVGVLLLGIGLTVGGMGLLVGLSARAPKIRLDEQRLVVDGGSYHASIERTDIVSVELRDDLPRVTLRTNG